MKTKILLSTLFASFLLATNLNAQAQTFEWVKQMGGYGSSLGNSITTDANGNVYTTGSFQGTADFDPGPGTANLTAVGIRDIFIQKLDASGNLLWAVQMGGTSFDDGNSITTDAAGNVYTIGYFQEVVDFDPGPDSTNLASKGKSDIFIQKLDSNGNFLWVKQMGGSERDDGLSITTDTNGNVYSTGDFRGTVDFNPGVGTAILTSDKADVFIQKLDANGDFVWVKQISGMDAQRSYRAVRSITIDKDGNVYTTGEFSGTTDFDPGTGKTILTSNGYVDVFIHKLDANGNFLWAKQMGGINLESGRSITTDIDGNVYTIGDFFGTADFDPGPGIANLTSTYEDIFIQKLDANGNFLWVKQIVGSSDEYGISIATDATGNVYTTGIFTGTADFDPGPGTANLTTAGENDIFIQKLDGNGNFIWVKQIGGIGEDYGNCITTDAAGNVYVTGYFTGTVDFDLGPDTFNLTSSGKTDIFILKLGKTGTVGITENTFTENIQVYPNPTTGNFAIKFETIQKDLSVRIMSVSGQILETRTFQNTDFIQLKLKQPNGIYLVDVLNEKGNKTGFRLIKK